MTERKSWWARTGVAVGVLVVVANVAVLFAVAFGVSSTFDISPALVKHNRGYAYIVSVNYDWPFIVRSSNAVEPYRADSQMFEDGTTLGPTHLSNETVRAKGGGVYSHWEDRLFFSTTDNSDPRTNGRTYTAKYSLFLAPSVLLVVGLVDLVFISLCLSRNPHARAGLGASRPDLIRSAIALAVAGGFYLSACVTSGAAFWIVFGGALIAALWCIVFMGSVVARVRGRGGTRWRWAGECSVIVGSCVVALALAELWLSYQEAAGTQSAALDDRLVVSLEKHQVRVSSEVLMRAKGRLGLLTMPETFQYRKVESEGSASDYYWHGVLHARDDNAMRRSASFPTRRDGVARAVVVGDSLTYGVGIAEEATYSRVLETLWGDGGDVEVLNLGVNGHQSEDILEVIREFVPRLEPDVVIYGVSHNDLLPSGLNQRPDDSYAMPLPPAIERFFSERSRVVRVVETAYDKTLLALGLRTGFYDQILDNSHAYQARFAADVKAMNEFVVNSGLPPVIVLVLDQHPQSDSKGHQLTRVLELRLREAGMDVISTEQYYAVFDGERFRVSKWEGHPNEVANIIWATMLADHLVDKRGH